MHGAPVLDRMPAHIARIEENFSATSCSAAFTSPTTSSRNPSWPAYIALAKCHRRETDEIVQRSLLKPFAAVQYLRRVRRLLRKPREGEKVDHDRAMYRTRKLGICICTRQAAVDNGQQVAHVLCP